MSKHTEKLTAFPVNAHSIAVWKIWSIKSVQVFPLTYPHLINLLFKVNQLNQQQLIWDYPCKVFILFKDFFF